MIYEIGKIYTWILVGFFTVFLWSGKQTLS